jgi:hypothetical protein
VSEENELPVDVLTEARRAAEALRESLPPSLSAAALGVRSKAPFQLLSTREALIWRTEELARNACDALEREDIAVAAILTRAVTESAALAWKLNEVLEARRGQTPQELNDTLMRLFGGSKIWAEAPTPFRIGKCIDRMDKVVPGVRASYNRLSEFAHPNYSGVFGLFSRTDEKEFTAYFGRGLRGAQDNICMVGHSLVGAIELFVFAYNVISDGVREFLAELESIWPREGD